MVGPKEHGLRSKGTGIKGHVREPLYQYALRSATAALYASLRASFCHVVVWPLWAAFGLVYRL